MKTRTWLLVMAMIAVCGTTLVVYFTQVGQLELANETLRGGGSMLGAIIFWKLFFGFPD